MTAYMDVIASNADASYPDATWFEYRVCWFVLYNYVHNMPLLYSVYTIDFGCFVKIFDISQLFGTDSMNFYFSFPDITCLDVHSLWQCNLHLSGLWGMLCHE